ncbi:Phosphatidate phosphatase APP1 [Pedococcus dokdonensis]|uniref:Phosphatidate phosphatase APP1 n=1 Tax=Pedococcus dokdonensis TaxID=443156 RepID=A0A1H0TNG5_9MICO|nr:phosphatase domain-containing protein [Pedococcus dokdonensis]SDP55473.1 Phosphatidate phosphatase APP1 [Pedococcus dokdonensis]
MARPHAASIVEDAWHRQVDSVLRGRGWQTRIVAHTGYATEDWARVLGRVLLTRRPQRGERADVGATTAELRSAEDERRGWRAFITAPAMNVPVTITLGDKTVHTRTDRSGYIDTKVRGHRLAPGWHEARLTSVDAEDNTAAVMVVGADETFGLISDIDDTVISTSLPRPMIAAWNTFVKSENARHVVPGMATMYRDLLAEHPGAPMVYLSTGAWNTAPTLTRFLRRHGYPPGPLLLTDWGPTNTGWFRSGQDHKRACLHRLANEFPGIRWVLVGDDGQHDPKIYGDFAEQRPGTVAAIAIRELTPSEQVLSHGIPVSLEEFTPARDRHEKEVPVCRAGDGYGLVRLLQLALGQRARES